MVWLKCSYENKSNKLDWFTRWKSMDVQVKALSTEWLRLTKAKSNLEMVCSDWHTKKPLLGHPFNLKHSSAYNVNQAIYIALLIIHSKYFTVSDWLKPQAQFTITSCCWKDLCRIEPMTSIVHPAAGYRTTDRENLGRMLLFLVSRNPNSLNFSLLFLLPWVGRGRETWPAPHSV